MWPLVQPRLIGVYLSQRPPFARPVAPARAGLDCAADDMSATLPAGSGPSDHDTPALRAPRQAEEGPTAGAQVAPLLHAAAAAATSAPGGRLPSREPSGLPLSPQLGFAARYRVMRAPISAAFDAFSLVRRAARGGGATPCPPPLAHHARPPAYPHTHTASPSTPTPTRAPQGHRAGVDVAVRHEGAPLEIAGCRGVPACARRPLERLPGGVPGGAAVAGACRVHCQPGGHRRGPAPHAVWDAVWRGRLAAVPVRAREPGRVGASALVLLHRRRGLGGLSAHTASTRSAAPPSLPTPPPPSPPTPHPHPGLQLPAGPPASACCRWGLVEGSGAARRPRGAAAVCQRRAAHCTRHSVPAHAPVVSACLAGKKAAPPLSVSAQPPCRAAPPLQAERGGAGGAGG